MKPPSYTAPFVLPKRDRDRLEVLLKSGEYPEWFAMRFRIVLLFADGMPAKDIARNLNVTTSSVYRWRRAYLRHGIKGGLLQSQRLDPRSLPAHRTHPDHGRYTAPFVLSDHDRATLEKLLKRDDCSRWLTTRFRIVLLSGDGLSSTAIADKLRADINSVYKWRAVYQQEGVQALLQAQSGKSKT